jgi:hypothetical protein
MNGIDQLSYCAGRMRNTKTIARANTIVAIEPALSSWKVMPVHSKAKSRGNAVAAARSMAATAWPEL